MARSDGGVSPGELRALYRDFARLEDAATRRSTFRRAMSRAMSPVKKDAKAMAPVREGFLQRSISLRNYIGGSLSRKRRADAASLVLVRNRREMVTNYSGWDNIKARPVNPVRYAHILESGSAHAAAQPFLVPAFKKHEKGMVDRFGQELWRAMRAVKPSGGKSRG